MASNFEEKNTHFFTWRIERFVLLMANHLPKCYTKSPMFTIKYLNHTSWRLVLDIQDCKTDVSIITYLERSSENRGKEVINVEWKIEAYLSSDILPVQQDIIVSSFKSGDSNVWGVFKVRKCMLGAMHPLVFKCYISQCVSDIRLFYPSEEKLVYQTEIGFSKTNYLTVRFIFVDKIMVSSITGIMFEFSFYLSNERLGIKVRRIDQLDNLVCHMLFSISVLEGNTRLFSFIYNDKHMIFGRNHMTEHDASIPAGRLARASLRLVSARIVFSMTTTQINDDSKKLTFDSGTKEDLQNDFLRMYMDRIHSDVELRVGDKVLPAHKCVLSIRSPVFSAMFNYDTMESQTHSINITDMDVETMELLLRFMYGGSGDELDYENSLKLFLAAEKYQVLPLKEKCAHRLENFLSVSNVSEILSAADMVNHQKLKKIAMVYIKHNTYDVCFTDSWKELVKRNLKLVLETINYLSDQYMKTNVNEVMCLKID